MIAGLGNPGLKYRNTRHNLGFRVVDSLAESLKVSLKPGRFQSKDARASYRNEKVILVCPLTFMNLSGQAVRAWVDYFRVPIERLLVVHDDIDLPSGRIRVVRNGGAGGHKGVRSIIDALGTKEFPRVKIGVDRPKAGESVESYVLRPVSGEGEIFEQIAQAAVKACKLFISEGIESAMNHINSINLAKKEVTIECRE